MAKKKSLAAPELPKTKKVVVEWLVPEATADGWQNYASKFKFDGNSFPDVEFVRARLLASSAPAGYRVLRATYLQKKAE